MISDDKHEDMSSNFELLTLLLPCIRLHFRNFAVDMTKKIITLTTLLLLCVLTATAHPGIGKAKFGDDYQKALPLLKAQFGEPDTIIGQSITYYEKDYLDMHFSRIVFNFRNNRFAEAFFQKRVRSRQAARREVKAVSEVMSRYYDLSKDLSDGSWFYLGGNAPVGLSCLFTIYSRRDNGRWSAVLRYGPYKY